MKTSWLLGLLMFVTLACTSVQPGSTDQANGGGATAFPTLGTTVTQSPSAEPSATDPATSILPPPAATENPYQAEIDKCWDFESAKDTDGAILCWENLLERLPKNYEVLDHLGNLYGAYKGDWERGIDYYKLAAEAASDTRDKVDALMNLSLLYENKSDRQATIDILSQVIEIGDPDDPQTIRAYLYLAHAYKMSARMSEACDYFRKAIELGTKINDSWTMNSKGQEKYYCP